MAAAATVIGAIGTASIVGSAGKTLLIQGVTGATRGIVSGVGYLLTVSSKKQGVAELHQLMDDLDILSKLRVIEAFIGRLSGCQLDKASTLALSNVKECLEQINGEISNVNEQIKQADQMGFVSKWWYGSPDLSKYLTSIKSLDRRFHQRLSLLIQMLPPGYQTHDELNLS